MDKGTGFIGDPVDYATSTLASAGLVIAEISAMNPNVCFEVGYAFALNLPIILISNSGINLPFYYQRQKVLFYDSKSGLRGSLSKQLAELKT
jgi:nucleoside 2-deoxyribosyltransferase